MKTFHFHFIFEENWEDEFYGASTDRSPDLFSTCIASWISQ